MHKAAYGLLAAVFLCGAGCQRPQPLILVPVPTLDSAPEPPPVWAGVDNAVAVTADSLASKALVSRQALETSRAEAAAAMVLARLADSLLGTEVFAALPADEVSISQMSVATQSYNRGARALTNYAEEPDSMRAARLLSEASESFKAALQANPADEDAHYWLARVYELQADALNEASAVEARIAVLASLVALMGHRGAYIALLADAHERRGTPAAGLAAGALWQRAAQVIIDEAVLDPEGVVVVDSARVFTHYARGSRAFVQAMRSELALDALTAAAHWAAQPDDRAYVEAERQWILWDGGNLVTRTRFDTLLNTTDAAAAAAGMEALLSVVSRPGASLEVRHELALRWYRLGQEERAIESLQSLALESGDADNSRRAQIREDYGVMAFNIGMQRHAQGELHAALGYLLQSEATEFSQSARASFAASRLLSNDISASLDAALRAEAHIDQLDLAERKNLYRHLIELHRRSGDRTRAAAYVAKYRSLR